MSSMNRIQHQIIVDLYQRDVLGNLEVEVRPEKYALKESDNILRLREFCFHVEQLVSLGFVELSGELYEGSDKMSFTYLNNAISLNDESFTISALGMDYAKLHLEPAWKHLISNKWFIIASYILVLGLGILVGRIF